MSRGKAQPIPTSPRSTGGSTPSTASRNQPPARPEAGDAPRSAATQSATIHAPMRLDPQTVRDAPEPALRRNAHAPGVLVVFTAGRPALKALTLAVPLELGRDQLAALDLEDARTSRRHLRLSVEAGRLTVEDLQSTNGVFLDGARITGTAHAPLASTPVIRLGQTVLLGVSDLTPFEQLAGLRTDEGLVVGPTLARLQQQVSALARGGATLFLEGERGVGKALLARRFLGEGAATCACAAAPEVVAAQLFDGPGLRARDEGLLLADLDALPPPLQSTLLRALESRPSVRVVSTSRGDLRQAVALGQFRLELYERLGRPGLRVPPLRERREEVSWHVEAALAPRLATAPLVEACLLRAWPGNVGELHRELRAAASLAAANADTVVDVAHLEVHAGVPLDTAPPPTAPVDDALVQRAADQLGLARKTALKLLPAAQLARWAHPDAAGTLRQAATGALLALLEQHHFQQAAVAQALDLSRTTLLKLVEHLGLPRASALTDEALEAALAQHDQDLPTTARALRVSVEALRQRLAQRKGARPPVQSGRSTEHS